MGIHVIWNYTISIIRRSMINSSSQFEFKDHSNSTISKKRPSFAKLDIEKMFQESIELTHVYNQLLEENKGLQKDFKKVEQAKKERQQFISMVERIVKEKSNQLTQKRGRKSSWLVFKLHKKITDLKNQIDAKDKTIQKLKLNKENQQLFKKDIELECLKQITNFAKNAGLHPEANEQDLEEEDLIKEIIWTEEYYESEEQKLIALQAEFEQQERETKRILVKLAEKKTELKRLREIQKEYTEAQESYKQERKKKEDSSSKKNYFSTLLNERDTELKKLEQLKEKHERIKNEEEKEIESMKAKLEQVRQEYENSLTETEEAREKTMKELGNEVTEQWVKRVLINEVDFIAHNMNYMLSLKGFSLQGWLDIFFKQGATSYSIQQIIDKLGEYPLQWEDQKEKKLIARYVVEDNGSGFVLEEMKTEQETPIIRSILSNLIGHIKTYTKQEASALQAQVGEKLSRFWTLIVSTIQIKEGNKSFVSNQCLQDGFDQSQLDFSQEEIDFAIIYLFSWSRDARRLQLDLLGKLLERGVKWIDQLPNSG